ncbi:MAG: class I SAM-dependent methyltransferase [Planctomycetota bacterium]
MAALSQLKLLYHCVLSPIRGETHQERLDSFYGGQAEHYDATRNKMLHGREDLFASLPTGGDWLDLGCGTGRNATLFGERIAEFNSVQLVDLSESLLGVAKRRIDEQGWQNVRPVHADVTKLDAADNSADLVTFAYSLTMIPDWFAALAEATRVLRPGGTLGVVDFYVSRKHPADDRHKHSWFTRSFWPVWFANDNVHPSPDHLPYLANHFEPVEVHEQMGKLPWIPLIRTPYYRFVGRKK